MVILHALMAVGLAVCLMVSMVCSVFVICMCGYLVVSLRSFWYQLLHSQPGRPSAGLGELAHSRRFTAQL